MTLTIVKVGGSYARFPRLSDLVAALERGGGRAIVVPGGGPFADTVRKEQARIGFDDRAAHRMALLAMAEFGYALASRSAILAPAAGIASVRRIVADGRVPVWLPLDLLDGAPEVPESWDMTSDSLAAWLAGHVGATRLIFVKRGASPSAALADLVAAGALDPLVQRFLIRRSIEISICGPRNFVALGRALATGEAVGQRVEVA